MALCTEAQEKDYLIKLIKRASKGKTKKIPSYIKMTPAQMKKSSIKWLENYLYMVENL